MSEIKHFGVLGMRWNVHRLNSAIKTQKKDAADFRKHGMNDHAKAIDANVKRMQIAKTKIEKSKVTKETVKKIKKKVDSHPVMVVPVTVFKSEAALQKAIKMQKVKNVLAGVVGAMAIAGLIATTFDH